MNGRHILLLGVIACAGLVSVHDGQQQVTLCYEIGAMERDLRNVREEIEFAKIRHRALQSPRALTKKANELNLEIGPLASGGKRASEVAAQPDTPVRNNTAPLRRPQVPPVPRATH
jgi:hypothetical protein